MLEWIITSCALILIVIALRYLLRGRIALRLQYALWALVLVRLLVPISFGSSPISVMNAVPEAADIRAFAPSAAPTDPVPDLLPVTARPQSAANDTAIQASPTPEKTDPAPVIFGTVGGESGENGENGESGGSAKPLPLPSPSSTPIDWKNALLWAWLAGAAVMLAVFISGNIRAFIRLKRSRKKLEVDACGLPVYISDALETPCLFGMFRPAVYVTSEAAADEGRLRHVIAHELAHARHFDHIFSALRALCVAVHWFNPLVWLAAVLSRRDQELACDEAAIARIGEAERAEYGKTLISLTCQGSAALLLAATTMTASKGSLKERVRLIAKKPRASAVMLIAVLIAAAIAIGCTFTGANKPKESAGADGEKQAEAPTDAPTSAPTELPTSEATLAPTPAPTPELERLSVPVYPDYELLLDNVPAPLGKDGCGKRNSGPHVIGINELLVMFPTDALRLASSGEEYLIFDSERGYREFVFIERIDDERALVRGFPIVIGAKLSYGDFAQLKLGDPIGAVERVDPVAALHRQRILDISMMDPETARKYCVGYNALASLHYLTDGILKIEYAMPAEGELVISNIIYSPDYTLKHFYDIEVCYRIEPIDLPERNAEPGDIELVRRYNEREVAMLSAFFDTVDGEGRTNGSKMSVEYVSGDPETWGPYCVHWIVFGGEWHAFHVSLDRAKMVGTLDVSRFPALEWLGCSDARLDSIIAESCPALTELSCAGNKLTELIITGCTRLERVDCLGNKLSSVDCTLCPALTTVMADWGVELIGYHGG